MEFTDLIQKRYSMRYFDPDRPVSQEDIDEIVGAAITAPTAHNAQAFHIYQLTSATLADVMSRFTRSHFAAPLVLALTMDESKAWRRRDGFSNASIDIGIVGTHMMLMAESLGIASCWVGSFDALVLADILDLPEHEAAVAILMLGYPNERAKAGPLHGSRKDKSELFSIIDLDKE